MGSIGGSLLGRPSLLDGDGLPNSLLPSAQASEKRARAQALLAVREHLRRTWELLCTLISVSVSKLQVIDITTDRPI